jgi:hypothetical protein
MNDHSTYHFLFVPQNRVPDSLGAMLMPYLLIWKTGRVCSFLDTCGAQPDCIHWSIVLYTNVPHYSAHIANKDSLDRISGVS